MAESQIQSVEVAPFKASEYIAAANVLMGVVSDFVKQGDLASAIKTLESVNLLLAKSNEGIGKLNL